MSNATIVNKAQTSFNTINKNFQYLDSVKPNMVMAINSTVLSPEAGEISWSINHGLNTEHLQCVVYNLTSGKEIVKDITIVSTNVITITMKSSVDIPINTYKVLILGV